MFDAALDKTLRALIEEWNIAERRIKKAEHVRGEEVVISAIFELRYAGRKMIDAFQLALDGDWKTDLARYGNIREQLEDAREDCIKAKHDAIDAMLTFVTLWFGEIEKDLGLAGIVDVFPNYVDLTSQITTIQEKIAMSRQNRAAGRDGIYDEIEKSDFDEILALYEKMLNSKERVTRMIAARQADKWWESWWVKIGGGAAVLLLIFEVCKFLFFEGHGNSP